LKTVSSYKHVDLHHDRYFFLVSRGGEPEERKAKREAP
jgi:hypothetical protein